MKIPNVKCVGAPCEQGEDNDGDGDAEETDERGGEDVFRGPDGGDEDVEQIARPDVFEEGDGETLLGAEEDVPKDHRGDEKRDEVGKIAGGVFFEEDSEKSPDHEIDGGPEDELDEADRVARVEEDVAEKESGDDVQLDHDLPPARASSMNISSSEA